MIGVEMRHDQPRELAARKGACGNRFPNLPRGLVCDPRVENRPAIAVIDKEDIDVVQPERQR